MRLQKYIANAGVTSRRKAEDLILQGRVKVNGKIVRELGTKVNPSKDLVTVDGDVIKLEEKKVYILLNKPEGYVTSLKDPHNDKLVLDLIKGVKERLFPVGRLDKDTSGLLIMTNDGNIAYKLTHPKYKIWKRYIALVKGQPDSDTIEKLKNGVIIDGKKTSKARVKLLKKHGQNAVLEISIYEGRNRQIRKMCEYVGHPVIKLKRVSIGKIKLDGIKEGEWRYLNKEEIEYLKII